tara:strand:+ start:282 stop:1370 length:1089 start_codon:yes stop_codon:yes gene_type:complete
MKLNKINIALLGCGRISSSHIKAIVSEHNRCDLVALCDKSECNLNKANIFLKEQYKENKVTNINTELFLEYNLLLKEHKEKRIRIDLIVICTPSGFHAEQSISAAKLGINVCTEKPMALKVEDGVDMIKTCKNNEVRLFVVKQNRLNPTLRDLREKVHSNKFGRIGIVSLNVFWQRPQSYYDQANWRGTLDLDGGALMNQASHYVDLLEWIIGPLHSLNASIATISRKIESEDTAVLNLKWRDGTLGSMAVTMITFPKNIEGSITIIGEKGSAKVGGIALNKYEFYYFQDEINTKQIEDVNYLPKTVYGSGHYEYYKNILDTLNGLDNPICDGESGLSSVKIINAAYKSAKSSKNIKIDDIY